MTDPLVPNFNVGVGRLATDRFDFQDHIDGYDFRQEASTVDLNPPIVITTSSTNVRDAIIQLKNALTVPLVPDATTVSKGVIQLSGDIGGTATNISVLAIHGFPVAATPPTLNYVLTWNGSTWSPASVSGAFTIAGDVTGAASATTVIKIQGKPVSSSNPSTGNALIWNGSQWTPTNVSPTGTGLASVTSGAFDAAATANVRYTGGKLQTDTNFQFKNASITGDLSWTPTSSNKTLTLPNATDTLVGLATADTLTNKTINVNNNTVTATSTVTGDILVSNGTKFVRQAQGTNGTFWGVSGGIAGYFAPPSGSISVAGTGFVTVTSSVLDATATANIRYTAGKFQSDTNIQFKNGGSVGDLAWTPSTTRTLTLPDATDTLVGLATTDTLTNKTINASNNTINDTSIATGDLLKSNGTKFVRFAKGSALQVLRVNSGGTDLEFAAPAGGGASSAGASGKVQLSNGSGGFTASTGMLDDGSNVKFSLPLSGSSSDSVPFRFKVARITYTGQLNLTMTAAQYECPIIFLDGATQAGSSYLICPQSDGMWLNVYNGTDGTISVKSNFSSVDLPNTKGAVCFLDTLPSNNKMRGVTSAIST